MEWKAELKQQDNMVWRMDIEQQDNMVPKYIEHG